MTQTFEAWFERTTGFAPHTWQRALAENVSPASRLVRVPTGMGKTLGVVGVWAYHRLYRGDKTWPRRLVLTLPMRVLVEQTERVVRSFLAASGFLVSGADIDGSGTGGAAVHTIMGGVTSEPWYLCPDQPAVLLGTQDMLLSRALNRGYASPRPRWPMEYAALNRDCLWVLDEIQLMGVGLATSAQLQAFRSMDHAIGANASWWMSATLQPSWLGHGEHREQVRELDETCVRIPAADRRGGSFAGTKSCTVTTIPRSVDKNAAAWAQAVFDAHEHSVAGEHGRVTLAVCNTVDDAAALHGQLQKKTEKSKSGTELRLVHSRFRPMERAAWVDAFLSREACRPGVDRIIVATQVVEAGVDISATTLVTQLAPWSSLVQRFGRCARYGGYGNVIVVDRDADEKSALPYAHAELVAGLAAVRSLPQVDCASLEAFEDTLRATDRDRLAALYPYAPTHLLSRREFDELFDTESDLTGHDLDISRFIRDGEDRDVSVFWRPLESGSAPDTEVQPHRSELCSVPIERARAWLLKSGNDQGVGASFVWDYVSGTWARLRTSNLFPGQTILVDAAAGGYDVEAGFTGAAAKRGTSVPSLTSVPELSAETRAELASSRDDVSVFPYKTIATHGQETAGILRSIGRELGLPERVIETLVIAGALHDIGKCHPAFQYACDAGKREPSVRDRQDLAKAPDEVWRRGVDLFSPPGGPKRRGFRHELVSVLMLFEWLRRSDPMHAALLGPYAELVEAGLLPGPREGDNEAAHFPLMAALDAPRFDLVAYLVCAHHGKIRGVWSSTPHDQEAVVRDPNVSPLRGVVSGDQLPSLIVSVGDDRTASIPRLELSLELAEIGLSPRYGRSWTDRVLSLVEEWGPTTLAYFESLVRVADMRASRLTTPDALLGQGEAS